MSRIRALGTAVGEAAAELDRRVLFIAGGGPRLPVRSMARAQAGGTSWLTGQGTDEQGHRWT